MGYVGISRRAGRDIREIEQFSIENWGEKVAAEYLDSIQEALRRLSRDPGLLRSRPEFSPHFRFYRVNRHFLVCSIVDESIYVLAVKHGSLDLPNRLNELEPHLLKEADLLHKVFLAKRSK